MKSSVVWLLAMMAGSAVAATTHEEAVKALGALNGTALRCQYTDEVRRIKAALTAHAPRTEYMGALFLETTNKSFLAAVGENRACPAQEGFSRDIASAIESIQTAVSPSP